MVEGLIFSKAKSIFVRLEILGLVDDVALFKMVAWGKLIWEYTAPTLKECLLNEKSNFNGTYVVKGFYDSLSVFAMECIPELAKLGVERVSDKFPKMANWKIASRYSFDPLVATIFKR